MINFTAGCQRKVIVPVKNDKAKSRLQHDFHKYSFIIGLVQVAKLPDHNERIGMSF